MEWIWKVFKDCDELECYYAIKNLTKVHYCMLPRISMIVAKKML